MADASTAARGRRKIQPTKDTKRGAPADASRFCTLDSSLRLYPVCRVWQSSGAKDEKAAIREVDMQAGKTDGADGTM